MESFARWQQAPFPDVTSSSPSSSSSSPFSSPSSSQAAGSAGGNCGVCLPLRRAIGVLVELVQGNLGQVDVFGRHVDRCEVRGRFGVRLHTCIRVGIANELTKRSTNQRVNETNEPAGGRFSACAPRRGHRARWASGSAWRKTRDTGMQEQKED